LLGDRAPRSERRWTASRRSIVDVRPGLAVDDYVGQYSGTVQADDDATATRDALVFELDHT
jgi:hypothetical protein